MTYNFSDSNRSVVRRIKEVQWGQTPSTGVSRVCSITSHSLSTKKNTVTSNTIRADRLVQDIILTEEMSDGSLNFEFSAGAIDDFLEAFVLGQWTRPMEFDFVSGTQIAWTGASTLVINSSVDYSKVFTAGRNVKTAKFINPVNNGYFTISTIAFASNVTTITMTQTTSVAEQGNLYSTLYDANDALVVKNTSIRSGTGGAAAFDSNGTNAFASAIATGQLVQGQVIHVSGLGKAVGTVTFSATAVAGDVVTVSDGTNSYAFTAGTDFAVGASLSDSATNFANAINTSRVLGISSISGIPPVFVQVTAVAAAGVVTLTNRMTGGSITKTEVASGTNITVANFAGGDNSQSGIFTITSLNSDQIFVSPAPSTNANAGSLAVNIKGSMLRNPLAANVTPQSFTLESGYEDVAKYSTQDGQRVQDFTIDINSSAIVTGSVGFMGRATTVQAGDLLGTAPYTVLDSQGTEIMNATTDVGALTVSGQPLTTALKQIKIDGKAQLRNQMAVGSKFPVGIGTGRFELTGTVQAYFANFELFQNFLNHDTISLQFSLADTKGNTYYFTIPALKLTADPINAKGIDQDVMEELTFSAFRDPNTSTMIQIDRFSSIVY